MKLLLNSEAIGSEAPEITFDSEGKVVIKKKNTVETESSAETAETTREAGEALDAFKRVLEKIKDPKVVIDETADDSVEPITGNELLGTASPEANSTINKYAGTDQRIETGKAMEVLNEVLLEAQKDKLPQ